MNKNTEKQQTRNKKPAKPSKIDETSWQHQSVQVLWAAVRMLVATRSSLAQFFEEAVLTAVLRTPIVMGVRLAQAELEKHLEEEETFQRGPSFPAPSGDTSWLCYRVLPTGLTVAQWFSEGKLVARTVMESKAGAAPVLEWYCQPSKRGAMSSEIRDVLALFGQSHTELEKLYAAWESSHAELRTLRAAYNKSLAAYEEACAKLDGRPPTMYPVEASNLREAEQDMIRARDALRVKAVSFRRLHGDNALILPTP